MQLIIYNQKGGVGKSMLATQISLYFDTTIIELDPYGMLTKTLDDRVIKIALDEQAPEITSGDVIYDFGGFDDIRLDTIAKNANLIILPFNPTINSLGTTLESYNRVKDLGLPILFIVNGYIKESDIEDAISFLLEHTQEEIEYFSIPHTRALQTAENEALSIIELANSGGLKQHTYKKISTLMQELMKKIEEYN
jgi:chromosome partitioning protein